MVVSVSKLKERDLVGCLTACWSKQIRIMKGADLQADDESSVVVYRSSSRLLLKKEE